MARNEKGESYFEAEPPVFRDSEIKIFLVEFINTQTPRDQMGYSVPCNAEGRKSLIDRIDGLLEQKEKDGEDLWSTFPHNIQEYVNDCFDALDNEKECPDFPDMKKETVKVAVKQKTKRKKKEKVQAVQEQTEEEPPWEEETEQKETDKITVTPPALGEYAEKEDKQYLCIAQTLTRWVCEDANGEILVLDKTGGDVKSFPSKRFLKNPRGAGRQNMTRVVTHIICNNPEKDLDAIIKEVTVRRHLVVSEETIRFKFKTIHEVFAWLEDNSDYPVY